MSETDKPNRIKASLSPQESKTFEEKIEEANERIEGSTETLDVLGEFAEPKELKELKDQKVKDEGHLKKLQESKQYLENNSNSSPEQAGKITKSNVKEALKQILEEKLGDETQWQESVTKDKGDKGPSFNK